MSTKNKMQYWIKTKSLGLVLNTLSIYNPKKAGVIAYKIFSHPREGKLNTFTDFLLKSEQDTLIYREHKIQTYHWKGEKETVLLIHGWESNTTRWQGMIQYLKKKKYNIVCLDAPAQGMSSGKELNAVLYAEFINEVCLKYKPTYLIGHSLGGMTMFFAQSHYQFPFVKKIVGLGSPNIFHRITNNYKKLISLNNKTYNAFLNVFIEKFNIDTTYFNTEDFIQKINIPVLVIHDKDDLIVSYSDAEKILKRNSNIEFVTTEKLGHSLVNNQVYKQVVSFIESE